MLGILGMGTLTTWKPVQRNKGPPLEEEEVERSWAG